MPNKKVNPFSGELYELTPIYAALINQYRDAETDSERESLEGQLIEISKLFEDEAVNIIKAWKNDKANLAKFEYEKDRISSRIWSIKNSMDKLKDFLMRQMKEAKVPGNRIDIEIHRALIKRNGKPKTNVEECNRTWPQEAIKELLAKPSTADFVRIVPTMYQLNAEAIITAWKLEKKIPEGIEIAVGEHIEIS